MRGPVTLLPMGGENADPYEGLPHAELLREVAEIVGVRLAQLLTQALQQAAMSLYRQAEQAIDMDKRLLNLQAGQLAQQRLTLLPTDLRRHFERRFPTACKRDPLQRPGFFDRVDPSALRILDDPLLEATLDTTDLSRAIEDACQLPLHGLLHQFRRLLQDPNLPAAQLPVGPRILAHCLAQALGEYPSARAPKLKVMQALTLHLPPLLKALYQDVHSYIDQCLDKVEPPTIVLDTLPELPEPPLTEVNVTIAAPPDEPPLASERPVNNLTSASTRADTAADRAHAEVETRLAGRSLPEAVQSFLREYWRVWLAQCHRQHGADSAAWQMAIATMDELIFILSPQPLLSAQSRLRRLPALLARLRAGMAAVGVPAQARDRFLVQWMQAVGQLAHTMNSRRQTADEVRLSPNADQVEPSPSTQQVTYPR